MNIKQIINKQDIIIGKVETLVNIVKLFNIIKLLSIKVSWVILETKLLKFISFTCTLLEIKLGKSWLTVNVKNINQ